MCNCCECTKEREHREFMMELELRTRPRKDPKPRDNRKLPTCVQIDGKSYELFCANCYRKERFFTGGGSWSPDLCDCGCEDTLVWHKMGPIKRYRAQKKYDKDLVIWQKKLKRNR